MQGENYEPQINLAGLEARSNHSRHRQMFVALVLLLAALILLVIRYRRFWFDSLTFPNSTDQTTSETDQDTAPPSTTAPSHKANAKQRALSATSASEAGAEPAMAAPVAQTIIPPMQVDVTYANGRHQTLVARDLAIHLSFSPETAEALIKPVQPVYPPLAEQSNVQGSVVLLAQIATDGSINSVQVVTGPDILAKAAVEAVRQWRFKPHAEGQLVPSETRIIVNFTISTP